MKIAVLGLNEAALVAVDAIQSRNHDPILVIPDDTPPDFEVSPLNELNFGYPGIEEDVVEFHVHGRLERWLTDHPQMDKAGFHAFKGKKPLTSNGKIIKHLRDGVMDEGVQAVMWPVGEITLSDLLLDSVDQVINTLDRARWCGEDDHTFIATRLWWSTSKGPKIESGNVVYNADNAPSWAITSNIDGRNVTIWDQQPPYDDVHTYDIPTKMACSCDTSLVIDLHLGRWATYRPISLSRTFEAVLEFLQTQHELETINADTLSDMEPIDDNPSSSGT